MNPLTQALKKVQVRLGLQRWARYTANALLWAAGVACVWLLLTRMFPLFGDALPVSLVLCLLAALAAGVWAYRNRPDLSSAALEADRRLGLRERFTSSLALQTREGAMVEALHRDAARYVERLNLGEDFPWKPSRAVRWLAVPLLLFGAGYLLLPEMDLFGKKERSTQAKANVEKLTANARKLSATAKVLKPREDGRRDETLDGASQQLAQIAEQLERQEITEKQALARVANLASALQQHRKELAERGAMPKLPGDPDALGMGKGIARDLQNGRPGDAAKKLRDLQEKLKRGDLSEKEKEALAKMMGGSQSQLGAALAKALAQAGANLGQGNSDAAMETMAAMELALEDMASAMEQMAMLDAALDNLGEWKQAQMGPSEYCRRCGKRLAPCPNGGDCPGGSCPTGACSGQCSGGQCAGSGNGPGMGGAGRGQGNRVGDLPDVNTNYKPTVLKGDMAQGKLLASILQKAAPEGEAQSELEIIKGAFTAVRHEAESALTKEEIPPGAREFVRQYFGAIAPEDETGR